MKQIEVKNLDFSYDENTHAVKNVSFSIEKGSYTTIIGHNGSGKSTIAKLLIGLLEKNSGDVYVDDLPLTLENLQTIRNKIGIVFQNPDNQFIGSTVRDDIAFGLENHCVDPDKMDEIIMEFAEKVNMVDFLDSEPTKLSGGQKQRVAIAGVLAMSPEIIIFDESTSMLDPQGKNEINEVIRELHEKTKMTLVSITHDIEEVTKSDTVIVMNNGQVVMSGKPEDVMTKEKELFNSSLDLPFSLKIVKELEKRNIKLSKSVTLEGLVDELCQLNSTK